MQVGECKVVQIHGLPMPLLVMLALTEAHRNLWAHCLSLQTDGWKRRGWYEVLWTTVAEELAGCGSQERTAA